MPTQAEKDAELLALAERAQNDSVNAGVNSVDTGVNVLPQGTATVGEPSAPVAITPPAAQNVPPASTVVPPGEPAAPQDAPAEQTPAGTSVPKSPPGPPTEAGSVNALDTARGSAYGVADANKEVGDAKADTLARDAQSQQIETDEAKRAEKEIADKQKAIDEGRAKANSIADAAVGKLEKYRFHDYFGDMSDAERIRTKFAVSLGAFAAAGQYSNDPHNQVLDQINKIIDQQSKRDEQEVRKQYDIAKLRQEGAQQFEANMASDLATIKIKQSHAQRAAASELKSQLMDNGVPLAKVEANATYKKLLSDADQKYAEGYEKLMAIHGNLALARFKASQNQPADPRALADVAKFAETHTQAETYNYAAGKGIKDTNKSVQPIIDNNNSTDAKKNKADEAAEKNSVHLQDGKSYQVASGRGGAQAFGTRDADFGTALDQLTALREDVKTNGERTLLNGSNRDALYNNATGAAAVVSPLGKNLESIEIEKGAIGPSGSPIGHSGTFAGLARGAQPEAIDRKIEEVKKKREAYRREMLVGYGKANPAASAHPPGSTVTVKGKLYKVGADGDTLEPQ
jgi:hypothetical protein